jgi:hypothetical protein
LVDVERAAPFCGVAFRLSSSITNSSARIHPTANPFLPFAKNYFNGTATTKLSEEQYLRHVGLAEREIFVLEYGYYVF